MNRRLAFVLVFASLFVSLDASAWGRLGHRLVAALAWDDLTPQARAQITDLLKDESDPTLPGIASWADELREHDPDLGKRTGSWHYVNIAQDDCRYDAAKHCKDGNCVVEAIRAQTAILADTTRTKAERLQALKFVVHFIGDVHQPLHAGFAHDKGGNDFQVQFDGRGTNLHSLWDSGMLKAANLEEADWLKRLRALPLAVNLPKQPLSPPSALWAQASCRIMMRPGFYPPKATIGDAYVQTWRPLAEEQLRRGGAELAVTLNAALSR